MTSNYDNVIVKKEKISIDGGIMIYIPKICGTCKGSTKALNLVYDIYEKELQKENPKKIYIYKEILHNPKVIEELNSLGIETIDTLDNITSDDIVIIRAHGESKEIFEYLIDNKCVTSLIYTNSPIMLNQINA